MKKILFYMTIATYAIFAILSISAMYFINKYNILDFYNINVIVISAIIMLLLIIPLIIFKYKKIKISLVITIVLICVLSTFNYGIYRGISHLNSISSTKDNIGLNTRNSKKENKIKKSFNVFFSGIDTYGNIGSVSRSDINILASVNTDKKKILLTTTPRDSYVKIPDGGKNQYDKLTHAGTYGINTSIKTLENLYGIKIDYYIRINFTSFIKLIDLLGGIDVYNDQDFVSYHDKTFFKKGNLHLNSKDALEFVRERYGLSGGAYDREKNQMKVIQSIFKKLNMKENLLKYNEILGIVSNSVQTNIPTEELIHIFQKQIVDRSDYKFQTQALKGRGSMGEKSFLMPNSRLYMFIPDKNSVLDVRKNINKVID